MATEPTGIKRPSGAQLAFLKSGARFKAFVAGLGGGKTVAGVYDVLRYAKLHKKSVTICTEPTFPMVRDILLPEFERQLEEQREVKPELARTELKLTLGFNGAQIWFRQADQFDKLRGPSVSQVWMDEAALCRRSAFDMLASRLRLPGSPLRFLVTTTPRGRNWVYEVFCGPNKWPDAVMFNRSSIDNEHLDEVTKGILRQSYAGTQFRQEVLGLFEVFEGLVYRDFDQEQHIAECPTVDRYWRGFACGVDWGWTDPAVMLVLGMDAGGTVYVPEEWGETRCPMDRMVAKAKRLRDKWGIKFFFCDPSQPANINEFQKAGLNAIPANNAILPGIAAVNARIGNKRLFLAPGCVEALKEFLAYEFPVDGVGNIKRDMPVDASNHYMDALRYAIAGMDGVGATPEPEQQAGYGMGEIIPGFKPVRLGIA